MKRIFVAAAFSIVAFEASAISRYEVMGMSCANVQAALDREGAAILRYRSARNPGLPLYGRYVKSRQYCDTNETLRSTGVPTADVQYCRVSRCVQIERTNMR